MFIVIGLIIGVFLGLTGAGGSVLAVPLLILTMGMTASNAMGLALGSVAAAAMYGAFLQRRNILWVPGLTLAVSGMLTAPLGKFTAAHIPEAWLLAGFSVLAVIIAARMWLQATNNPEQTLHVRAAPEAANNAAVMCRLSETGQFQLRPRCLSGLVLGGVIIGFASGLLGVGGGFLIVPLLLFLSQVPMVRAVATSLLVIAVVSSSGFSSHLMMQDHSLHPGILWLVIASLAGMLLSRMLTKYIAGPVLQKVFSVTLVIVVVATLVNRIY